MNIVIIGGAHAGNLQYAINYCDLHRDYNLEPEYTFISPLNGFVPSGVDDVDELLDQKFAGINPNEEFLVFLDPFKLFFLCPSGTLNADVQRTIYKIMNKLSNYNNARLVIITDATLKDQDYGYNSCIENYKLCNCNFKVFQRAIDIFDYNQYTPLSLTGGIRERFMHTVIKIDLMFQLMRHEEYWKSGSDFGRKEYIQYNVVHPPGGGVYCSFAREIKNLPIDYEPYNEDNFNKKMARLQGDSSNRSEELAKVVTFLSNQEVFKETGFNIYLKKVRVADLPSVLSRGVELKTGDMDYEVDSYHKVFDSKAIDQAGEINYMCNILSKPNQFIPSGVLIALPKGNFLWQRDLFVHTVERLPRRHICAVKSEFIVAVYKQDGGLHLELKNPAPMLSLLSSANESTH